MTSPRSTSHIASALGRPAFVMLPLLVFAWFAATAWIRPLAVPDEGRYVGVAWEMLVRGDWMVPSPSRSAKALLNPCRKSPSGFGAIADKAPYVSGALILLVGLYVALQGMHGLHVL